MDATKRVQTHTSPRGAIGGIVRWPCVVVVQHFGLWTFLLRLEDGAARSLPKRGCKVSDLRLRHDATGDRGRVDRRLRRMRWGVVRLVRWVACGAGKARRSGPGRRCCSRTRHRPMSALPASVATGGIPRGADCAPVCRVLRDVRAARLHARRRARRRNIDSLTTGVFKPPAYRPRCPPPARGRAVSPNELQWLGSTEPGAAARRASKGHPR